MKQFQTNFSFYTALSIDQVVTELDTNAMHGLNSAQVAQRRSMYGYNLLTTHEKSLFVRLLIQFSSPFIYVLLGTSLLYFFLENKIEALIIMGIVLVNGLIGFYQEYKADKAIKFLKKYLISYVRVVRSGQEIKILHNELVPGDIVFLYPGDNIPADVRFIDAQNLTIDESVVTGESTPVHKTVSMAHQVHEIFRAETIGFSGTTILTGKAKAIVFAIGSASSLGRISSLTTMTEHYSSFAKSISQFSSLIVRIMAISILVIFLINFLMKQGHLNILEFILFCAALAVSVVPEALPLVITFALSRGALELARQKAVVKRLSSIEELGSIEILCCDKTGTLTENAMVLKDVYGADERMVVIAAFLAGSFTGKNVAALRSFDRALYNNLTVEEKKRLANIKRIFEFPFDSYSRSNAAIIEHEGTRVLTTYGSVDIIVSQCIGIPSQEKDKISQWVQEKGYQGYRLIAVAQKKVDRLLDQNESLSKLNNFEFLGMLAFEDPLKRTAIKALQKAGNYGIQCKILSGDAPEVCGAIALQVGLIKKHDEVITGAQFAEKSEQEQRELVKKYHVFSRVSPEQKHDIIKLLQEEHEVGYLGDGINDAPALKQAGVALAVYDAADIAREVADIILLEKSLLVIVNGIVEGRKIFANTQHYLLATLAPNFGNFYALIIISLFIDFLPMLPLQILLLNFLSDFPLFAIATDTVDRDELKQPGKHDIRSTVLLASLLGTISMVFHLLFFMFFFHLPGAVLRTAWFLGSILSELVFIFSVRTKKIFFRASRPGLFLISLTLVSVFFSIIIPQTYFGQTIFHFAPLSCTTIALISFMVCIYFVLTEIVKRLYIKMHQKKIGIGLR